jgi:general L-amino acid transport system substrate-binding protein
VLARFGALLLLIAFFYPSPALAGRLDDIRARGFLGCGVYPGVTGFATVDRQGNYSGFDIDLCRGVAAAIFGRGDRVRFTVVETAEALKQLPEVDLVVRRLTWTASREGSLGLMFGPITFFDGQGFLVPKALGIGAARDLAGRRVCVDDGAQWGETWPANLQHFAHENGLAIEVVVTAGREESAKHLLSGECQAYSADQSLLGAARAGLPHPDEYAVLPEQISKEPLAPLVRQGDDPFFQVVRWTIFALIDAEELGITAANAEEMRVTGGPDAHRLLGDPPGIGRSLGLGDSWAFDAIRAVGNYGEMFDRSLGAKSPIKLDRGRNALWTKGGLMYAPPVR